MDALVGEDETLPKNRMALICRQCRLVNGQASPGIKRSEDVGKWRCGGCGAMNGEESEAKKIISSIREQAASADEGSVSRTKSATHDPEQMENEAPAYQNSKGSESDVTQYTESSGDEKAPTEKLEPHPKPEIEPEPPRRRSTRSRKSTKEK